MTQETTFHRFLAFAERHVDEHGEGVLGGEQLFLPPVDDYGYASTPRNALTFGTMGVDGVHYAILQIDGLVREDSPVVYVSPMDPEGAFIVAPSFLEYLADGCGVTPSEIVALLSDPSHEEDLCTLLVGQFDHGRLLHKDRLMRLADAHAYLIQSK